MSFTSRDLFGACWMRSSTSKSKLIVRTFVVLPLPFGVLFQLLFVFSSCSIIFVFTVCLYSNVLPRLCPCYRFIRPWHAFQCITAYERAVRLSALWYGVTYPWLHALLLRHVHINVYNAASFFLVCWSAVKVLANIFQPSMYHISVCFCLWLRFPFSVGVSLSLVGKTRHKPLFCYIFNCSGVRFSTRLAAYTALLVSCLCHALFFGDHLKPLLFSSLIVSMSGFSWCLMRRRSSP